MKRTLTSPLALVLCTVGLPLAAAAQTLILPYESVFKDYQPHKDVPLQNWKSANEAVHTAGGWRAYQRESQAPDAAPPTDATKTQVNPAPHVHGAQKP